MTDRGDRRYLRGTMVLLIVMTAVVFSPLRRAAYVQDDHLAVEQNPVVARGDVAEIFSSSYWEGAQGNDRSLYRPVTILSYALERRAAGRPDPRLSHAVNVILHLGVCLLLLVLARRLGMMWFASSVAALLFAVHPIHTEAVANVVGRAEILAALFTLAALLAHTHAGPWGGARAAPVASRVASWTCGAMVFLAAASKEGAVVLPLLLVSLEVLFRRPRWEGLRRWLVDRAAALGPAAVGVAGYLVLRTRALGVFPALQTVHAVDNFLVRWTPLERIPTALSLVARSVRLLVFPVGLSADYSGYVIHPHRTLLAPAPLLGLLLLGLWVLLGLAAWLPRTAGETGRTARRVAFSAHLFVLPYLVTSNLFFLVGAIFAERFLYLPSVGFCLLLGITFQLLATAYPAFPLWTAAERSRLVRWIALILLAAFSLLTWQRCTEWRTDETVFAAAARIHPDSPRAQLIVGKLLARRGRADDAMARFDRVLRAWPEYATAWFEKGVILGQRGDLKGAEKAFRNTIRLRPSYASAYVNLGTTLHRLGRLKQAENAYRKGVLREPDSQRGWAGLGHVLYEQGRRQEADQAYRRAVALGRTDLLPRLSRNPAASRVAPPGDVSR